MLDLDEIPIATLKGDGLELRALTEDDVPELYSLIDSSREFLAKHLPWPDECRSEDDVLNRLDSWELQSQMGSGGCWGIFDACHEDGVKLAGCIILGWVQREHHSASVSYWLGKNFTGKGLATKALSLLSRYCFADLKFNRLEISASVTNVSSQAVALRCGFAEEGKCREFERINGIFEDHFRFSKLASDA